MKVCSFKMDVQGDQKSCARRKRLIIILQDQTQNVIKRYYSLLISKVRVSSTTGNNFMHKCCTTWEIWMIVQSPVFSKCTMGIYTVTESVRFNNQFSHQASNAYYNNTMQMTLLLFLFFNIRFSSILYTCKQNVDWFQSRVDKNNDLW